MPKTFIAILIGSFMVISAKGQVPAGFTEVEIARGLNPTTMALAPDGRLFLAMKDGRVLVLRDDVLQEDPYLSIEVDNFNERGLSGIALHPDFETNQIIYLYYTVPGANHNRLSSFRGNGDFAIPGSETVLLDLDPLTGTIHNGGAMKFGLDGKLYLAVGDGALAGNAQSFNNLLGKFLRLNEDGSIPEDNPFYQSTQGKNRAIWALGFRNPYTFDIQPTSGRIICNDVGGSDFEEVNEVLPGMNYGWPGVEGFLTSETPPDKYKDPLYAYDHSQGCAVIGSAFYNPQQLRFPPRYHEKYFFADYCAGYIKVLDPDLSEVVETFATGIERPLAMVVDQNGDMYYLERPGLGGGSPQDNTSTAEGRLWKILYTGSGAPNITLQPEGILVPQGESSTFKVEASGDQPLTYQWQRDQVDIAGANDMIYTIENITLNDHGALFRCVVQNSLGVAVSDEALLEVTENTRPVPEITLPLSTLLYRAGEAINFEGKASDPEDGILPQSQLTWWIEFHHDEHTHPALAPVSNVLGGSYQVPRVGETSDNVWYRIYLRATDNQGLSKVVFRDVFPLKTDITITTDPAGLNVNIDGKSSTTPTTVTGVVGIRRTLEAAVTQQDQNNFYLFQQWESDPGSNLITFDIPETPREYQASYQSIPLGPGDGLLGHYFSEQDQTFEGAVTLKRIDPVIDFNWGDGSPASAISSDFFTARWFGFIQPLISQEYTFYTLSDDGVRLWVDDQLIIDKWIPQAPTEWSGKINLEGGEQYPLKIEYFEQQGGAVLQLWWSTPLTTKSLVPSSQLLRPDLVLAIPDVDRASDISIYPVPTRDFLFLDLDPQTILPLSLEIYDLYGRQLWHKRNFSSRPYQWKLNLSSWKPGTYFLKLITDRGSFTKYLLKI